MLIWLLYMITKAGDLLPTLRFWRYVVRDWRKRSTIAREERRRAKPPRGAGAAPSSRQFITAPEQIASKFLSAQGLFCRDPASQKHSKMLNLAHDYAPARTVFLLVVFFRKVSAGNDTLRQSLRSCRAKTESRFFYLLAFSYF